MSRKVNMEDIPSGGPAPITGENDRIAALEAALEAANAQLARIAYEAQAAERARVEAEEEQERKIREAEEEAFNLSSTYAYLKFGDGSTLNARIPMGVLCKALAWASPTKGSQAIVPTSTKTYHGTPETLASRSGAAKALSRAAENWAVSELESRVGEAPEKVIYRIEASQVQVPQA